MQIRFFSLALRYRNQTKNFTKMCNMDKCYFRYEKGNSLFDVSFVYKSPDMGVLRQFNFSRRTEETVDVLLQRITTNIAKVVNKKNKKKKGSDGASQDKSQLNVQLFENDHPIPADVVCQDLLTKSGIKLKVVDQNYEVVINAPWVHSISLSSSILSAFPVYPVNLKTQFADKTHCSFKWYTGRTFTDKGSKIADVHVKWEEAGSGYTFIPSTDAIGKKVKVECIPGDGKSVGPVVEAVSPGCVEAGPGKCPFENRHAFTQHRLSGKSFRVVSYNILADLYCDSDFTRTVLHPYCPAYALHLDYRKQLIIKELLGLPYSNTFDSKSHEKLKIDSYNADVACLQEVDKKIYEHELTPVLGANSYEGVFINKGKDVAEGLACFFRRDRFKLLDQKNMVFSKELANSACFKEIWDKIKDNKPLVERVLDRSTAGLIAVLESIDNAGEIVVVGNTHLYFHPDADHIRLIQGGMMIYWLREVVESIQTKNPEGRVSVLICGDFNSVPSCGIYQLYTTGAASSDLDDWKSKESEAVIGLTLKQDLILRSACGTPEYTNFTAGFADCLDYIYYDPNGLQVEQVVPFPSVEELNEHTALPSVVFPSDHIALIADLTFVK